MIDIFQYHLIDEPYRTSEWYIGGFFIDEYTADLPRWCGIFYASDLDIDGTKEFGSLHE